jgi:hypothetical protein
MIALFTRLISALTRTVAPPPPDYVRKLKGHGYRVAYGAGYWRWYRRAGAFSGRYTTEKGAWGAAWEDYEDRGGE